MNDKKLLAAAKDYVGRGWWIFPLHTVDADGMCSCGKIGCSDAGKHPRVRRGVKEATRDLAQIEQWFGEDAPAANIGLATGEISGITVLDIDIGEGKFGAESWAEAIEGHGEPETLMARTGSGGMHVFFLYNSSLKTATNALGKGIDCRNDGGYVVAPPSRHRSGGRYEWINAKTPLASLPAHLAQRRKENRGRPRNDDIYRTQYTVEQVESMLEKVPPDDRDLWRAVGIILGREFKRAEEAWKVYNEWSDRWKGKKGRNHDLIMREAFYEISQASVERELTIGTIVKAALDNGWVPAAGEVPIGQFVFYGPGNNFIYRPTGSYWTAGAVDSVVSPVNVKGRLIAASEWLRRNAPVTSLTRDPSLAEDYVKGVDCVDGESVPQPGAAIFNLYRGPSIELGVGKMATPFLEHVAAVFNKPGDADQFLDYMAHRVQRPWEKPRFALLIAGEQGVGKDTAIEFCAPAIGVWNVANIDPSAFEAPYNEFAASTLVRISEAANLHEMSRWAFNERTKVLIAGSPDVMMINPKYGQKYVVKMCCGVIITTNHLASGIYIPADDRRYDVIECATMREMGLEDEEKRKAYFTELWQWFVEDGDTHVAAFLHERDISRFSPSTGQRKTAAHSTVVAGGMEFDSWLIDVLDELGNPDAVRVDWVIARAASEGEKPESLRRRIAPAMGRLGYGVYRNPDSKDGRWRIDGKQVMIYAKAGARGRFEKNLTGPAPF